MWILRSITENNKTAKKADLGLVTNNSDSLLNVQGSQQYHRIASAAPYGIESQPPKGAKSVIIPLEHSGLCIGICSDGSDLQEGELKLFSSGGAEILLKKDGSIEVTCTSFKINGKAVTGGT